MKQCKKCMALKPLTEFYWREKEKKYLRSWCIDCWKKESKKWRIDNPQKVKRNSNKSHLQQKLRWKKIKDNYGLGAGTIQVYGFRLALKIYDKYNRKCAICGEKDDLTLHHKDKKGRNYINKGLKPNNSENNLVLVCRRCHGSIHGKEGKGIKKGKRP